MICPPWLSELRQHVPAFQQPFETTVPPFAAHPSHVDHPAINAAGTVKRCVGRDVAHRAKIVNSELTRNG